MLKVVILNIFLMFLHPVHVSVTSIDQVHGSDTLKVFFRMYYDDFLLDYKLFNPDFKTDDLSGNKTIPDIEMNRYFNDRVRIYINNKLITGRLSGVSNNNYEITLSLVYKSETDPEKFRIKNEVLIKLFEDQTNMIYLNINNYQDAMRLTPGKFSGKRKLK